MYYFLHGYSCKTWIGMHLRQYTTGQGLCQEHVFNSQGGNILFPRWECFVPKVGNYLLPNKWRVLHNKGMLLRNKCSLFQKVLHLSRPSLERPLFKGILGFSSLPWTLPSSLPYLSLFCKRIRCDALRAMLIICTFAYSFIILQLWDTMQ